MTVISLARLQLALGALRLSEDYLTTVCPPVEKLLMRQRRLDRLQQLSDHMAMQTAPSRPPRIFVELDDESLEVLGTSSQLDQLAEDGKIGVEDARWLRSELQSTAITPWFAGLDHLNRRLATLAAVHSRLIERLLGTRNLRPDAVLVQLLVLFSTVEPGVTADALLTIATNLNPGIRS